MTGPRFTITRRWARHIWHVRDNHRLTIDVIAFRPDGAPHTAARLAIVTIIDEATNADVLAYLERKLARKVGLRIP